MATAQLLSQAQEYMAQSGVDGWLLYEYRGMNPFFSQVMGRLSMSPAPSSFSCRRMAGLCC